MELGHYFVNAITQTIGDRPLPFSTAIARREWRLHYQSPWTLGFMSQSTNTIRDRTPAVRFYPGCTGER
ncbi:hypothetical protein JOY44_23510 [Phormidium sp. CLA17]|uniref:hypothetical protein n=1 Tax=Leptolyngbya sp. Cla-17 TaxID=2803751 RepID=UPI0014909EFF|nr:hypothetical protein [Leptolyngbya sp. Cla-17]MBM0744538.1 hypothetical protein [Leptolyngbya sp. Cla-17]